MPEFLERDPEKIYKDTVAKYEELSGHKLYSGQPEHLLIGVMSYRESLVRSAVQDAATQNLVALARKPFLDELGRLVGVTRIGARKAKIVLKITPIADMVLPANTKVQSKLKKVIFENTEAVNLDAAGMLVEFTACDAGAVGNGMNDVTLLISPVKGVGSISAEGISAGGADEEDDERIRGRIMEAPEHYSVAGPRGAYRYFAMSASSLIKDVAVLSSSPGVVDIYVLSDSDTLELVKAAVAADDVRPLTDCVNVHNAVTKPYKIDMSYTSYINADAEAVRNGVDRALSEYAERAASKLGVDIVSSQLIAGVMAVPGIYSVMVRKPVDSVVLDNEVAALEGLPVVKFEGAVNG